MDDQLQKFRRDLEVLKERFASVLGEKLTALEEDWGCLKEGFDRERLERLHRGVHSLAGSGTTFGLPDVSRAARALEIPLKALIQERTSGERLDLSGLDGAWETLKKECSRGRSAASKEQGRASDLPGLAGRATGKDSEPSRTIVMATAQEELCKDVAGRLEKFGYSVVHSMNLHDVLPLGDSHPLALLLDLDSMSPELTRDAKRLKELGVTLIALSARDGMDSRLAAVRLGAEDYLLLPVDTGWLLDKLETLSFMREEEPFRVLIVDDEELIAERNAIVLRQNGMDARTLADPMRILHALDEFNAELVLLDVYMPGCSGPEAAAVIRQRKNLQGLPILYLSSEMDPQAQFEAVSQGGDDFLIKPIEPDFLLRAVANRVKRYRTVHSMMVRDSLTGLLNHTNMKQQIRSELERLGREGGMAGLAIIDLDKFKAVNDTYGHQAGDVVLKNLSRFLANRLRKADMTGRMGGEEFAVLLRGISGQEEGVAVMDKLREAFSRIAHAGEWGEIFVTFSCGMAFYPDFTDVSSISAAADMALYEAKRNGRNQVRVHAPSGGEGAA
jgi:diguanylate cyclase (GGDEF)-like protein